MRRENFAKRRKALGFSQESLAQAVEVDRSTVGRWENGETEPQPWHRPALCRELRVTAEALDALLMISSKAALVPVAPTTRIILAGPESDDELDAMELARRVTASDVGSETLLRLELAFHDLARKYPSSPPQDLLERVRKYARYVAGLLDAKKTLSEHRQLLVLGGWFSLLGATLHIDLNQQDAATARLRTAATLARDAEHAEIQAWCHETDAWRVLTDGEYSKAVELSKAAQALAPRGSSIEIQATAQEGRAYARLNQPKETYGAIARVHGLVSQMKQPDSPEHHFQYDPAKSTAYTATTLAWVGDPAAETYAREVIAELGAPDDVSRWPRRVASANIDLALSLVASDHLDEAASAAQRAILSGRIVPSNHWRALEVVRAVETRKLSEAKDLREAYEAMRPALER
ncbi:transcriptional regulator with XRE-family HTH domain [Kitasatospora sp. MAA4]|uniref:helix-turn-helix transcriptional regulator n=1 Tax=Kitasatospora sp. MAA4 TaxID=3035093 RepID=UPI00247300A7|nr:helix-turn-helix transcriptional regulator [Kitasatospora sp. MAA4]MDH6135814.1 transcriptional regulator with XRE-family HTH domain [Kitasatospora sp. MAA4]